MGLAEAGDRPRLGRKGLGALSSETTGSVSRDKSAFPDGEFRQNLASDFPGKGDPAAQTQQIDDRGWQVAEADRLAHDRRRIETRRRYESPGAPGSPSDRDSRRGQTGCVHPAPRHDPRSRRPVSDRARRDAAMRQRACQVARRDNPGSRHKNRERD